MRCPYCKKADSRVVDSRAAEDGNTIRRRRECSGCGRRFTTYEVVEKIPLMVIKKSGNRQVFDKNKLMNGLIRSCDKRVVSMDQIKAIADDVERVLRNSMDQEITTEHIGELVMERLKNFDEVAYIRFASVYRKFKDIGSFRDELDDLIRSRNEK